MENLRKVVVVDGCRIPFQKSGTGYQELSSYDLARLAVQGLIHKTQIARNRVDSLIMGIVVADVNTSNVAREVVLATGLDKSIPAYTITSACISSNRAITNAFDMIRLGEADVIIAGGTDSASDFPIRFRKKMRKKLMAASKYRTTGEYIKFLFGLRPSDFFPELPNITEFSTGLTMGQSCERMANFFGATRKEQDEYAIRTQLAAAKAQKEGILSEEIFPVYPPPKFTMIKDDNGIREDTTMEKLSQLKPAFVKKYGTITAGNSSFLTDGASAVLIMSEEKAKELGYKPKATIKGYTYTAHEPLEQLLLGPAFVIPKILDKFGLNLANIGVFEIHEAFAAQMVTALKCLSSDNFAQEYLGKSSKVGEIPLDKLNIHGGSLALGHPFGATGSRLVTTAANRLVREKEQFGLITVCAAGAMANAILLERYEN